MPHAQGLATCELPAQPPAAGLGARRRKLARNLPGPFAVIYPDEGERAAALRDCGLRAFRFIATARGSECLPGGYHADVFRHVPLTVWAFTESAALAHAVRQISTYCPAQSWAVRPAA